MLHYFNETVLNKIKNSESTHRHTIYYKTAIFIFQERQFETGRYHGAVLVFRGKRLKIMMVSNLVAFLRIRTTGFSIDFRRTMKAKHKSTQRVNVGKRPNNRSFGKSMREAD